MDSKIRYYVGHIAGKLAGEVFRASETPTAESHPQYTRTTGPFITKRAAVWASQYGATFDSIAQAERLALAAEGQSELCRLYDAHLQAELNKKRRDNWRDANGGRVVGGSLK